MGAPLACAASCSECRFRSVPSERSRPRLPPRTIKSAAKAHIPAICREFAPTNAGSVFSSFTTVLAKTDRDGKLAKSVSAARHHGDLCFCDGKIFVAVNLEAFNDIQNRADSWVYVYDVDLTELALRVGNSQTP